MYFCPKHWRANIGELPVSWMASSSSSLRAARPSFFARSGSFARSSRPMAVIMRLNMESPFAPMTTYLPSRVVYVFDGAMPGRDEPVRSRIKS